MNADIIKMAREAGIAKHGLGWTCWEGQLERFYNLARAAEREACAKVCEQSDEDGEGPDCWGWHAKDFAAAIRARSQT